MENYSNSDILEEVKKLQTFYILKSEIRYGFNREEQIDTESVAEHVYGMFILANYFLPLENPEGNWDKNIINDMILYHDIDEIETGDTIGYLKTNEHKSIEIDATKKVIDSLPTSLQTKVQNVLREYTDQEIPEARFVKAIDKFEPLVQLFCENGLKINNLKETTLAQHWMVRTKALQNFPTLMKFSEVMTKEMEQLGHFAND